MLFLGIIIIFLIYICEKINYLFVLINKLNLLFRLNFLRLININYFRLSKDWWLIFLAGFIFFILKLLLFLYFRWLWKTCLGFILSIRHWVILDGFWVYNIIFWLLSCLNLLLFFDFWRLKRNDIIIKIYIDFINLIGCYFLLTLWSYSTWLVWLINIS